MSIVMLAAAYFLFVLWRAFLKWRDKKDTKVLLIILMVPGMHLSYGLAQWVEFFRPGRDLSIKKCRMQNEEIPAGQALADARAGRQAVRL